nr:hypothetical protein CTI12_AA098400 [Tanacetum cinerariifolium]
MPNGQPNKKKSKKAVFTIYLKYDGIFITNPLSYVEGISREINDINFNGMSFNILVEIINKLMPGNCHSIKRLYYCKTSTTLALGVKELKYDKDVEDMLNDGYDNGNMIDLFIEHYDHDTEADDCVVIKDMITSDPFLNKICSTRALFRGSRQQKVPDIDDIEEDPDNEQIDPLHKAKKEGRCACKKGNKNRVLPNKDRSGIGNGESSSKKVKKSKVKKSKVKKVKKVKKKHVGNDSGEAHSGKEIIGDPFIPYRKMKDVIRVKYVIDVSLGQYKRAKQRALYDHEGDLIEHYSRLYDYRQAILDINHGSTYRLDVFESDGSPYFKRMYICIKGVKDGWLVGCRKVIDDLALNDGTGITIISESHKGLLDAVSELLPQAEHRKCTRNIYYNFKKKFSGVQLQKLFWYTACSTIEKQFQKHMEQIKLLNPLAYDYLIQRDPNTWSIAFFEMDRRCATFENGISKSFNRAILSPRSKPIITMLEEIRLYIMQRLFAMNKIAVNMEDDITPSIRKRLEVLKEKQSGFQELEVRNGDESYAVNLQHKVAEVVVGVEEVGEVEIIVEVGEIVAEKVQVVERGQKTMEYELSLDEEAFRETMEEQDRLEQEYLNRHSKKRNRQKWQQQAYVDVARIYVKNRRRSKRIANQKHKFDPMGTGSTTEKALSVSDSD